MDDERIRIRFLVDGTVSEERLAQTHKSFDNSTFLVVDKHSDKIEASLLIPTVILFHKFHVGLLQLIRRLSPNMPVFLIYTNREHLDAKNAWIILECGALDIFFWQEKETYCGTIANKVARWNKVENLLKSPEVCGHLIGRCSKWIELLRRVAEVAHFSSDSIMLIGESGTGKGLLAKMIHKCDDARSNKKFVVLDCSTIVESLSGSEFFGHEVGAFTGAVSDRDGVFASANGGTLFLDEIGELPLSLQTQLLRVIETGQYKRLGGNQWRLTNFRLICATNRDLEKEVNCNRFRLDLYYRIANSICRLPTLADRKEDIPLLAEHFLLEMGLLLSHPVFDSNLLQHLYSRPYLGNVRELRQLVRRIGSSYVGTGPVTLGCFPPDKRPVDSNNSLSNESADFEMAISHLLNTGHQLTEIIDIARSSSIRVAFTKVKNESDHAEMTPKTLYALAAEQLGCSPRWIAKCDKKYKIKPTIDIPTAASSNALDKND